MPKETSHKIIESINAYKINAFWYASRKNNLKINRRYREIVNHHFLTKSHPHPSARAVDPGSEVLGSVNRLDFSHRNLTKPKLGYGVLKDLPQHCLCSSSSSRTKILAKPKINAIKEI